MGRERVKHARWGDEAWDLGKNRAVEGGNRVELYANARNAGPGGWRFD